MGECLLEQQNREEELYVLGWRTVVRTEPNPLRREHDTAKHGRNHACQLYDNLLLVIILNNRNAQSLSQSITLCMRRSCQSSALRHVHGTAFVR